MPKGLLDKLTREEILDLMAYVIARGDAGNPVFHLGRRRAPPRRRAWGPVTTMISRFRGLLATPLTSDHLR